MSDFATGSIQVFSPGRIGLTVGARLDLYCDCRLWLYPIWSRDNERVLVVWNEVSGQLLTECRCGKRYEVLSQRPGWIEVMQFVCFLIDNGYGVRLSVRRSDGRGAPSVLEISLAPKSGD